MNGELTPELVDAIIGYLDRPKDDSRVWQGVRFMEREDIDPAIRCCRLHRYVAPRSSRDPRASTMDRERELPLGARRRARLDEGLTPLSGDDGLLAGRATLPPADGPAPAGDMVESYDKLHTVWIHHGYGRGSPRDIAGLPWAKE